MCARTHWRNLLEKSVIRAILLCQNSPVCGGKAVSNIAFLAKSKISIVFGNFFLSFHYAYSVRGLKQYCLQLMEYNAYGLSKFYIAKIRLHTPGLCNVGNHQRHLNEAIQHNKLVQLFPLSI